MWQRTTGPARSPFHELIALETPPANGVVGQTRLPDAENLHNLFGTVHGGALFTVGEVAAGRCMNLLLGEDMQRVRATTRKATIEYLKPARGAITGQAEAALTRDQIMATLERQPSVAVPVAVTLLDEAGQAVCRLAVEWYVARPKS